MDLRKWLLAKGVGQRELGRRLGYDSNGVVQQVVHGRRSVPRKDAPDWAKALELNDAETSQFLAECEADSIPDWVRAELAELRQAVRLRDDILGTGVPIDPTAKDLELCDGDEAKAKRLALWRRAQQFTWERIAEAEGRKKRPVLNGREIQR